MHLRLKARVRLEKYNFTLSEREKVPVLFRRFLMVECFFGRREISSSELKIVFSYSSLMSRYVHQIIWHRIM